MTRTGLAAAAWTITIWLSVSPTLLVANGGTLRLNTVLGPFEVIVFTDPTPVRVDSIDVSVLITRPGSVEPVEGLEVQVRADPVGHDGESTEHRATREQAEDPRFYAAKFRLGREGAWRITVSVSGEEGGGEDWFQVNAIEPGPLRRPLIFVIVALTPLALAAWWLYRGGQERHEP
jgi:hypothetical protein